MKANFSGSADEPPHCQPNVTFPTRLEPLVRVPARWKTNLSPIWQEEIKLTSVQADKGEAREEKKTI